MAASQSTESSSSDLNKGQNASTKGNEHDEEVLLRTAGPAHVDGSSMGIELDELTLDILLVSICPCSFVGHEKVADCGLIITG